MTTAVVRQSEHWTRLGGSFGHSGLLMLLVITDYWWPGSITHTLVQIAVFSYFSVWLGLKIRMGYARRRPLWTRESWRATCASR